MTGTTRSSLEIEHEELLMLLYACPSGLADVAIDGTFGLVNPCAIKLLMPIVRGPWINNLFIIMEPYAPQLRGLVEAFPGASGSVFENYRVFIDAVKVFSFTLVKLGAARCVVTITDVSELVAQEQRVERVNREMEIQNGRFDAALRNIPQALCMFDAGGRLVVANARLAEMFGLDQIDVGIGSTIEAILARAITEATLQQTDVDMLCHGVRDLRGAGLPGGHSNELSDGRTLAASYVPMEGGGWLLTLDDITERKLVEAKIAHMAYHDALTGLPNRVMFRRRLFEAVARGRRGEMYAVLFLDLDRFKAVNDTNGHAAGDVVLQEVGRRLQKETRETDTVARLGGDEFAVVQSRIEQRQDAAMLAKRLIHTLSKPYQLDGQQVVIGASIGIALAAGNGEDPDQLLNEADTALYAAKAAGRGDYRFFEPEMVYAMQARRVLESELREAISHNQFELYYQPLMNIKTRTVKGFEALIRWNHPERGMVPPGDFIPLAEELGLIVPLGKWVLNQACVDAATWPGDLTVAVNVSAIQFGCPTLVADVTDALRVSGLPARRLEIEITETVMLDNTDKIIVVLHQLRDLGLGIAMDDFGTGFSSLDYLRRFPFSKVKIDRSFTAGLSRVAECDAIVTAITDLCETLGVATLAEGVETEEQLHQLQTGHCDEAQGYLFSKPQPASEVAAMCLRLTKLGLAADAA